MRLIEIQTLYNGAHNNQTINGVDPSKFPVPDGWAVIPDDMVCENFPFGEVETAEIDGVMTVTKWTPGTIPEPEPVPEPGEDDSLRKRRNGKALLRHLALAYSPS